MLIKDVYEICHRFDKNIILSESMSFSDFRKEIANSWVDKEDIKTVLDYIRKEPLLKKKYNLNDYLDLPYALLYDAIRDYKNQIERDREKKNFVVVYDSSDWQLVVPLSFKASKYIAHNYLRHAGDESEFSSGPTWCTTKNDDFWKEYTEGKSYPIVYYFISKKDSMKRFTIVFNNKYQKKEQQNLDIEYNKENFEKGHTIAEMNGEIRDFSQVMSRDDVIKAIEKTFDVSLNTPINENNGKLNITQIVYDNFKLLQSHYERNRTEMDVLIDKIDGSNTLQISISNLHQIWKNFISLKKKYNLKRGVDYHKDLLEAVGAFYRYRNEGSIPSKVVDYALFETPEDVNYECFFCAFLMSLLSSDMASSCYFILYENFQYSEDKDVKVFKSIINTGKYKRLCDCVKSCPELEKNIETIISFMQNGKHARNNFSKYGKQLLRIIGIESQSFDVIPISSEVKTSCSAIYGGSLFNLAQEHYLSASEIISKNFVISDGKLKKKPSKIKSDIDEMFDGMSLNLIDAAWRSSPFYETPVIPNNISNFIFTQILLLYKSYIRDFISRYRYDEELEFYGKIFDNVYDVLDTFTREESDDKKEEMKINFINYIEEISRTLSSKYKATKISTGDVRNYLKEIIIYHK